MFVLDPNTLNEGLFTGDWQFCSGPDKNNQIKECILFLLYSRIVHEWCDDKLVSDVHH